MADPSSKITRRFDRLAELFTHQMILQCNGNRREAARRLGVSVWTVYRMLKRSDDRALAEARAARGRVQPIKFD